MEEDRSGRPSQGRAGSAWLEPSDLNVKLVYGLYIASFLVGITAIVGVVFAYLNRGRAEPWLQSHYTYQIRTFWIGLLYGLVSALLVLVGIGILLFFALMVWAIARSIKGLQAASRNEPIARPETWLL